jgi:hypothetical protein
VLRVARPDVVFDGLARLVLIEHEVIKRHRVPAVLVGSAGHKQPQNWGGELSVLPLTPNV